MKDAKSIKSIAITRLRNDECTYTDDILSVEEPLEIRLVYGPKSARQHKSVSVTMRTPGHDADLAVGFLFTEGIIPSFDVVEKVDHHAMVCEFQKQNEIEVELVESFEPELKHADRNFYTSSSCGVCGKGSIQSIRTVSPFAHLHKKDISVSLETLYQLPDKLREAQHNFDSTGGIHASGLFSLEGELLLLREDVGRHNALDKLIGNALQNNLLPLNKQVLLLSGRASFELIQKAAMAGIQIIAAIGAPSSLAVELAKEFDITLVGFLKPGKGNIYHHSERILMPILSHED